MYPPSNDPPRHIPVHHPTRGPSALAGVLAVLLLLVSGALVVTVWQSRKAETAVATAPVAPATAPAAPTTIEPRTIAARGDLAADEQSTIELFQRVSPAVVHVNNLRAARGFANLNALEIPQGSGTGFLWDTKGNVVTNYHVVQGADNVEVVLNDGTRWKARPVGFEPDKDLAVLHIDAPADKLRSIAVGSSSDLQVGQKVFAIGNPFGLDQTLTTGVISGLDREIKSVSGRTIQGVVQTDAAINPGNSGGPLLDSAGRLIGVNTAIYSPSGAYAGIGFAVPVDTVNRIVPELVAYGKVTRPGLGIVPLDDRIAQRNRIEGLVVRVVPPGSAAAKAGLVGVTDTPDGRSLLGDVIVGVEDRPVRTIDDLYQALDQKKVGDRVTLSVNRRGEKRTVTVTLQAL